MYAACVPPSTRSPQKEFCVCVCVCEWGRCKNKNRAGERGAGQYGSATRQPARDQTQIHTRLYRDVSVFGWPVYHPLYIILYCSGESESAAQCRIKLLPHDITSDFRRLRFCVPRVLFAKRISCCKWHNFHICGDGKARQPLGMRRDFWGLRNFPAKSNQNVFTTLMDLNSLPVQLF